MTEKRKKKESERGGAEVKGRGGEKIEGLKFRRDRKKIEKEMRLRLQVTKKEI